MGSSSLYSTAHMFQDWVTQLEMQVIDGTTSMANRNQTSKTPMPIRMPMTAEPAPYSSSGPRNRASGARMQTARPRISSLFGTTEVNAGPKSAMTVTAVCWKNLSTSSMMIRLPMSPMAVLAVELSISTKPL